MSAGADLMPNPPLLGASRDEIARIIRGWDRPEPGYRAGPGTLRAIEEADRKADQILALPAFAGLLTPSLSHEEEDHTVARNSGTTCRGAEPAAPANAGGFTPGPWHRNIPPATKYTTVWSGRNTHVAHVTPGRLAPEEVEANLCLIAAAPDQHAALKAAEPVLWTFSLAGSDEAAAAHAIVCAAIAKATGGAA